MLIFYCVNLYVTGEISLDLAKGVGTTVIGFIILNTYCGL